MAANASKLTAAVGEYLAELRRVRGTGAATEERSYYPALSNLLNAVGGALRPKVFSVIELGQQGAGHPDIGLFVANQVSKGQPRQGQLPASGVVEVKAAHDDAWLTADGAQVSRYWRRYRQVLVTNTRDFVLLGEDGQGNPARLETFRLAGSAAEFEERLEHPRAFANTVGPALAEYLTRVMTHPAKLTEPRDLARLLASYARDGLARVESSGDASSLNAVRAALEEALGVGSRASEARRSSARRWCKRCSKASFPRGCCGRVSPCRRASGSTGAPPSGTCARRSSDPCSSSFPTPDACSPSI